MRIAVIGTGYVGLVSGACFAEFGLEVRCADIDAEKISTLQDGDVPFHEPGLAEKVEIGMEQGRLEFTTEVAEAIRDAEVVMIAVGTPSRDDGSSNLEAIDAVAAEIGRNLNGYKVIATKSTVPPRTGERIAEIVRREAGEGAEFDVVSNPEFLREGSAVEDFMRPDRIVIGADSERAVELMKELYRPLYLIETPFVITSVATAEMIKYASNAFLATKISFINEVANLSERVGADVHVVAKSMGLDGRISSKFLHPGPGFGGSCFPKDVSSLVATAEDVGYDFQLAKAVLRVNRRQRQMMVEKVHRTLGVLDGKRIAVLGLSFKPNTDDMREAPSVDIIRGLLGHGAEVRAHDPAAMEAAKRELPDITYCADAYEAAEGADAVVLVTEWNQYRNLDLDRLEAAMRQPVLVDLRNVYEPERLSRHGFTYVGVGRG